MKKRIVLRLAVDTFEKAEHLADRLDTTVFQLIKDSVREAVDRYESHEIVRRDYKSGAKLRRRAGVDWSSSHTTTTIQINESRLRNAEIMASDCKVSLDHLVQSILHHSIIKILAEEEMRMAYILKQQRPCNVASEYTSWVG